MGARTASNPANLARRLVVCACALLLGACVSGRTYRTHFDANAPCVASDNEACAGEVFTRVAPAPGSDAVARMGFVEFDDQGYLRDRGMKNALLAQLGELERKQPVLLIAFAHGWKHNADPRDGNVAKFRDLLTRLAAADARLCDGRPHCQPRQVVGVYLGWRGLSWRVGKNLTFWQRKASAERVGSDGASEVLQQLDKVASARASQYIILGHSFGGALAFSAVDQLLMESLITPRGGHAVSRTVANLVVLVNPAFEAARFHALRERAAEIPFVPGQRPLFAVFTSRADWATRQAFPVGRTLGTLGSEYTNPTQRREDRTTIGHYAPFWTHRLEHRDVPKMLAGADARAVACGFKDYQFGRDGKNDWSAGPATLERLPAILTSEPSRFNPLMIVRVDGTLIGGHNDIWNDDFTEFLYRFLVAQDAQGCPRDAVD